MMWKWVTQTTDNKITSCELYDEINVLSAVIVLVDFSTNQLLVYYVNTHTEQNQYFVNVLGRVRFVITLCPKLFSGNYFGAHIPGS